MFALGVLNTQLNIKIMFAITHLINGLLAQTDLPASLLAGDTL